MNTKADTSKIFINKQMKILERIRMEDDKNKKARIPNIPLSMEPGSGGSLVAQNVARKLELYYFHSKILHEIAESGKLLKEDLLAISIRNSQLQTVDTWYHSERRMLGRRASFLGELADLSRLYSRGV